MIGEDGEGRDGSGGEDRRGGGEDRMDTDEVTFIAHDNFISCSFLAHYVQHHHSFHMAFTPPSVEDLQLHSIVIMPSVCLCGISS